MLTVSRVAAVQQLQVFPFKSEIYHQVQFLWNLLLQFVSARTAIFDRQIPVSM